MRINTNVASLTAQEAAVNVGKNLASSLEKLSTGLRINKASDDAAGMSIADKLRTQASSIGQGISNANSANTFIQISDKAMGEQSNILDIVKTKLLQAATSTTSSDGRNAILSDIQKLLTQLDNIASQTNYNGTTLLQADGTDQGKAASLSFQVGELSTNTIVSTAAASNTAVLGGFRCIFISQLTVSGNFTNRCCNTRGIGQRQLMLRVTGLGDLNCNLARCGFSVIIECILFQVV